MTLDEILEFDANYTKAVDEYLELPSSKGFFAMDQARGSLGTRFLELVVLLKQQAAKIDRYEEALKEIVANKPNWHGEEREIARQALGESV